LGESDGPSPSALRSVRNLQPNINDSAVVETASATIIMMMAKSCIKLLATSFTTASLLVDFFALAPSQCNGHADRPRPRRAAPRMNSKAAHR
jgi:hypothetical protein